MRADLTPRTVAMVAMTVALASVALVGSWPAGFSPPFWFWLLLCVVGESLWVRLPLGRATISMASCCNLAAVLVLARGEAMVAAAAAGLIAELAVMRKPPLRAFFNAAQTTLAVAAASLVFSACGGSARALVALISHAQLVPFLAAAASYYAVNTGSVSLAVALRERVSPAAAWRSNFGGAFNLLATASLLSIGVLLAVLDAVTGTAGTLLVVLPVVLAYQGYQRHAAESLPLAGLEEPRASRVA